MTDGERQRRILLIAPQPFYEVRGTPMNVLQMCRALTRGGYLVDLATYPLGASVEMPGLTIHRSPGLPGIRSVPVGFSLRKVLLDVPLAVKAFAMALRRRYIAVHAVEEAVFFALPLRLIGLPIIYDMDSLISDQLDYAGVLRNRRLLAMVRKLERMALRRCRAAITVCGSLSDSVRVLAPDVPLFQIEDSPLEEFLRPPVPSAVAALRDEFLLGSRSVVLYTGNLEPYQGIDLLVDAVADGLRAEVANLVVILVGGSEPRLGALRSQLAQRGLADTVLAIGTRPTDEMPEWMALADVLVSPRSHGQNTPLKIYAYMRSSTPIVATRLVTHTTVLDDSTALLCPATPQGIAEAIRSVLNDPQSARRRAQNARTLTDRDYNFDIFQRRLLEIYDSIDRAG